MENVKIQVQNQRKKCVAHLACFLIQKSINFPISNLCLNLLLNEASITIWKLFCFHLNKKNSAKIGNTEKERRNLHLDL